MSMISVRSSWHRTFELLPSISVKHQRLGLHPARMSSTSSSAAQPGAQQLQKKPIYFGPFEVTNQVRSQYATIAYILPFIFFYYLASKMFVLLIVLPGLPHDRPLLRPRQP